MMGTVKNMKPFPVADDGDERLFVEFAQTGKPEIFEQLLQRHQNGYYRLALFICRNKALAEESVQEAVLNMLSQAKKFKIESGNSFKNWSYGVVRNTARYAARKEAKKTAGHHAELDAENSIGRGNLFEAERQADDAHKALSQALDELDAGLREVVVLHYMDGMTYEEIGRILGVSAQMVHKRGKKGLQVLRNRLATSDVALSAIALEGLLRSGWEIQAPPTLVAKLTALPLQAAMDASVRAVAVMSRQTMWRWIAAMMLVSAGGLGTWLVLEQKAASPKMQPQGTYVSETNAQSGAGTAELLECAWNFDDKKMPGLKSLTAQPEWGVTNSSTGDHFLIINKPEDDKLVVDDPLLQQQAFPIILKAEGKFRPPCLIEFDLSVVETKRSPAGTASSWGGFWHEEDFISQSIYDLYDPNVDRISSRKILGVLAPTVKKDEFMHWKYFITEKDVYEENSYGRLTKGKFIRPWKGEKDNLYIFLTVKRSGIMLDNLRIKNILMEDIPDYFKEQEENKGVESPMR
jgi:RNA polymerase sigma-70 factor (ECF subfamily)